MIIKGKNVFSFTIHCYPMSCNGAGRDLQSSQRNESVQSLVWAGHFLYNQQQPSAEEGEVVKFLKFKKKPNF